MSTQASPCDPNCLELAGWVGKLYHFVFFISAKTQLRNGWVLCAFGIRVAAAMAGIAAFQGDLRGKS